ncbi:MAG: hypothetical protein E7468_01030 [Ruminococcaceae bacterium]|nr:hypothetical protein [Oscillospiraceae bacterium]
MFEKIRILRKGVILMQAIAEIDTNFKVETKINKPDIKFYDIRKSPFQINGVFFEDGQYRRMPAPVAKSVSDGVFALHTNTAGGRVRFKTDSPYIAIYAKMPVICKMPHFALTGSAGFDLYCEDGGYVNTFVPPLEIVDGYESYIDVGNGGLREFTINFPLYSDVSQLYVGLSETATVCAPTPYMFEKPVVYYGSSITQGGCASRPGSAYESILTRRFSWDHINLGFSGNAKGETEIAEYISGLDMAAFVYDYDHNAPSVEHLQLTHEPMFKRIRRAHPDLPIIMMSRPKPKLNAEEERRLQIIRTTYRNALENGDRNVYLIEGAALMEMAGNEGTVDTCHPTDLGFASMASKLAEILKQILSAE